MPFDWKEDYHLAHFLSRVTGWDGFSSEAARRSAVSRAYYSAFCHSRNYAISNLGFIATGFPEDHKELRKLRNYCDYNDIVANLPTMVNNALTKAKKVIDLLP